MKQRDRKLGLCVGVMLCALGAGLFGQPKNPSEPIADRNEIEGQLATKLESSEPVVARGEIRVTRTIHLTRAQGVTLRGDSAGGPWWPSGFAGTPTVLRWAGEPGGTMLVIDGSVNCTLEDLTLDGGGKAGVLVQIRSQPGFGSGGHRFERVTFRNADVAVRAGEAAGDFNCADVVYDQVTLINCGVGLQTLNDQSVNHHFRSLTARAVGTVLDIRRGGNVLVDGADVGTFDLLLRVGHGGPNAGTFRFEAGRFEMDGLNQRHARLVDAVGTWMADVVFDGCQETAGPINTRLQDNAGDPVCRIGPGAVVSMNHHLHSDRSYVSMSGGTYRDRFGRWPFIEPSDERHYSRKGGRLSVVEPTNRIGEPERGVQR